MCTDRRKGVTLAATAQDRIFAARDVHVVNHLRGIACKLDRNLDIVRGQASAIFDDHTADENDVGNFVRRQCGVGELWNGQARAPKIECRSRERDKEDREKEPGQHGVVNSSIARAARQWGFWIKN